MDRVVKFGIVGLGSVSGHHIRSIMESPLCELTAVCSRNEEKLKRAAEDYNVKTFTNYNTMFKEADIDVVTICTPSGFHLEPALAAAKARIHVLVEKPLEINRNRANQIIEACKLSGVKFACIFQNRYSEEFVKVAAKVRLGGVGKLLLGNAYVKWFRDQKYYEAADWRGTKKGDGGAALINQSIHTIDLLLQVFGPVKSVMGKVKTLTHDIEGEDLGLAILEFENGAMGTIEGSTSIAGGYPEKLEIHGESGNIIMEGGKIVQWDVGEESNSIERTGNNSSGSSDPMAIGYALHKKQIEAFVDNINNNADLESEVLDSLRPIEVIEAIYESSRTEKVIYL